MTRNSVAPSRRGIFAWCLYDWANSAFPTVITTFVFSAYFTQGVAANVIDGTSQWGYAMSLSALAVAFAGPVLGAVAGLTGARKPWIFTFMVLCVSATSMLWFIRPDPGYALLALVLVSIANFAFEMGMVFYNSMLPNLAGKSVTGRISGWGWGMGYAGGLVCLGIVLVGLVQNETPWFGLDRENAEHLRATAPLVAVWFAIFSVPLFYLTPDTRTSNVGFVDAIRRGIMELITTVRRIRDYANIARFLLARMVYTDGLNTLFAFGGIYGAGSFGMNFSELVGFGIAINAMAGLGAAAFAWLDDRIGPKKVILISLTALALLGVCLLVVKTKAMFWFFALGLGIFIGPSQSASRSMMARLAPPHMRVEMFGLYALSGKATAFLGPAALAFSTTTFASQRAGMATIIVFFTIGIILLLPVSDASG